MILYYYCYRYWKTETAKHKNGGSAHLWLAMVKCLWWRLCLSLFLTTVMVSIKLRITCPCLVFRRLIVLLVIVTHIY